jgi:hypothetical protein
MFRCSDTGFNPIITQKGPNFHVIEDSSLPGSDAVSLVVLFPTFRKKAVSSYSGFKHDKKTSGTLYPATKLHTPEDLNPQQYRRDNLKNHIP